MYLYLFIHTATHYIIFVRVMLHFKDMFADATYLCFFSSLNDVILTAPLLVDFVIGLMKSLKCIVSVAFNFCHTMRYFTRQSIPYSEHDEECYSEPDSKCSVKRDPGEDDLIMSSSLRSVL